MEIRVDFKRGLGAVERVAEQAVHNINLPRNFEKGSWKHISKRRLFVMLLVEVWELFKALYELHKAKNKYNCSLEHDFKDRELAYEEMEAARDMVKYEAGDCVAFVAFIVDRL